MKKLFLIIAVLNVGLVFSQSEVDFKPKKLTKHLEKLYGDTQIDFLELENHNLDERGEFFTLKAEDQLVNYLYVGRVNSCRATGCSVNMNSVPNESYEYFDYYILFDEDKSVISVRIFNYAATHGQEVTSKGWLKQFVGYNGSKDLVVGKNIDAISNATISVYGITEDIQSKTQLLNSIN